MPSVIEWQYQGFVLVRAWRRSRGKGSLLGNVTHFQDNPSMNPADNFRNLLLMAASDGRMTEPELRLLSDRAAQLGVTDDQFKDALVDAISGRATLSLPNCVDERIEILKDLLRMMAADGKITDSERQLFALASGVMKLTADRLNDLIDELLEEL